MPQLAWKAGPKKEIQSRISIEQTIKIALFSIIYCWFHPNSALTIGGINTSLTSKLKNNVDLLFTNYYLYL